MIGKGRAQLLEEIQRTGSIKDAASGLGLSYRHAWGIISEMGKVAGCPVVVSTRGGRHGGGSVLSDEGRKLLEMYRRAETERWGTARHGFEELRCKVVTVDRSKKLVVLRSLGDGDVVVTVTGGDLSSRVSPDDEIILMPR